MSYKTAYNQRLPKYKRATKPPQPSVITSFPIGNLGGQQPAVYVQDITNGYDLYTRNPNTPSHYPASCAKMMTLLLAREYHASDWTSASLTVTAGDVTQPYAGITLSSAGFQASDVTTWEGLAYGAMLASGFDACTTIARLIGNELYAAAGNTGTQGVARFVERMNARATELNLANTTYFDPFGGSETSGPTVRNILSAKDLAIVFVKAMADSVARAICGTTTHGVVITGANARTITLNNVVGFINGPTLNPSLIKDTNVIAAKSGVWVANGQNQYNLLTLWKSPAGYEVVISTLGTDSSFGSYLDQRGLMYSLLRDFPYLDASPGTDPNIANVKLLIGADGSITDESTVGRTLTNTSVTVAAPGSVSSGGMLFNALTDTLTTAHTSDLRAGSGDMVIEWWFQGTGSSPGAECCFIAKDNSDGTQKEWLVEEFSGALEVFVSTDGSNWSHVTNFNLGTDRPILFNGAPRHMALVKHGSEWSLYLNGEKSDQLITASSAFAGTAPLNIGFGSASVSALGTFDEVRATFGGTARYTANMVSILGHKFPRS